MNRLARCLILLLVLIPVVGLSAQQSIHIASPAAAAVVKMSAAQVGDDVLLAYIQAAKEPFHLSADDIIELKNSNIAPAVILAMLNHDVAISEKASAPTSTPPDPDPAALSPQIIEVVPAFPGPGYWAWGGYAGRWPYRYYGPHRRY